MFKRKKLTEEERERLREERIQQTSDRLKLQVMQLEKKKQVLLKKVLDARRMGLKEQEAQARSILKKCLVSEKRANGMLMTLELAVETRDLADLNYQFLESIGAISEDIRVSAKKSDAKKAEKKYLKAIYGAKQQTEDLDAMLEAGDYASAIADDDVGSEFDKEISELVDFAESGVSSAGKMKF